MINGLHEVIQTAIPLTCVDSVLKTLTKYYNLLATLTKLVGFLLRM